MIDFMEAVILCKRIYEVLEPVGYYPALTGGCLYKRGLRKDVDIVIYRNRQRREKVDMREVMYCLNTIGIYFDKGFGFVTKAHYNEIQIDFLNPEDDGLYNEENEQLDM